MFEEFGITLPTTSLAIFASLCVLVLIDAILGAIKAGVSKSEKFDPSFFAAFIPNNFVKYILPLVIPAVAGHFWHEVFYGLFIAMCLPVYEKFVADIILKWKEMNKPL